MVNEPRAAEGPQWVGDPMTVELVGESKQEEASSKKRERSRQEMEQGQWG